MAVKELILFPDPILRLQSRKIHSAHSKDYIRGVVRDLIDTATSLNAAGLAAVQIGVALRIMVVRLTDAPIFTPFINPEVTIALGSAAYEEGCLSLPGLVATISRPVRIRYKAERQKGNLHTTAARRFLHELDHLNGILIIDKEIMGGNEKVSETDSNESVS